jgi:hypothetical protein
MNEPNKRSPGGDPFSIRVLRPDGQHIDIVLSMVDLMSARMPGAGFPPRSGE